MIYGTVPWDPHNVWRECPAKVQSSLRFRHSVQDSFNINQHRLSGQRGVQASAQHFGSASSSYNDVKSQKFIPLHGSVLSNIIFYTNMMLWRYKASRPTSLHQIGLRRPHLTTVSSLQTNLVSQKYFKNRLCSKLGNKAAEQPRLCTPLDHSRECLFFHSIDPWLWICMMLRRLSDSPSGRSTRIGVIDWREQDVDRGPEKCAISSIYRLRSQIHWLLGWQLICWVLYALITVKNNLLIKRIKLSRERWKVLLNRWIELYAELDTLLNSSCSNNNNQDNPAFITDRRTCQNQYVFFKVVRNWIVHQPSFELNCFAYEQELTYSGLQSHVSCRR